MSKSVVRLIIVVVILSMWVCTSCSVLPRSSWKRTTTIIDVTDNSGNTTDLVNTFKVVHTLNVKDVPATAKFVRMWLPLPQTDANQRISHIRVLNAPAEYLIEREENNNNKFLYCELAVDGRSDYYLSYEFTIERRRQSLGQNSADKDSAELTAVCKEYLAANEFVEVDDKMKKLAKSICGNQSDPIKQARLIYDWIIEKGEYWKKDKSKYAPSGMGSTSYFMEQCTGNCTDFHAMFLSLMRARGIPTRLWFGAVFAVDKQNTGNDLGYHCWPEFYDDANGWVVVDVSQADFAPEKHEFYFGNVETRRVVFTQGRDINLAPKQSGPELIYMLTAYAEVDGKPYDNIERHLSYQLLK